MKVILSEFVPHLGDAGDKVEVAPGYARNYLLPRNLAFRATSENIKTYENNLKQRARKLAKLLSEVEAQKEQLEGVGVLEFVRKSGESGKLFGSVTSADVGAALAEKGYEIDKRRIALDNPIKSLGETGIKIKLHPNVVASVKVLVSPEQEEEPKPEDQPEPGAEEVSASSEDQAQEAENQAVAEPESAEE